MASMAKRGPVTMSPPANISDSSVWRVILSTSTVPFLVKRTAVPLSMSPRSTRWPIAATTQSTASSSVSPVGTLLRRPPSSGSPSCMSWTFMPVTASPPRTSAGAARNLNFTPSASASAISSSEAGISSRPRR